MRAGLDHLPAAKRRELEALLVTRSEDGMSLYTAGDARHVPAQTREVFDVSGAGDTVIATMAMVLAAGADAPTAMTIANQAAGVVVGISTLPLVTVGVGAFTRARGPVMRWGEWTTANLERVSASTRWSG